MPKQITVWDPLVRLFHWSLVLTFSIAYFTGEEDLLWHVYSGYIVLGLISFRVIWGFIGTKYARFSSFLTGISGVFDYLRSLTTGTPKQYPGHNPAGGWMIVALLFSLFVTSLSGLQLYAVDEGSGPFAADTWQNVQLPGNAYADDDDDDEDKNNKQHEEDDDEFWEEIHEVAANITLLLVFFHITGVLVSARIHKENLVKAMITGKKTEP